MRILAVRTLLFLLAFVLVSVAPLAAQEGAVSGTVRDLASATPVAGVRVEVVAGDGRVVASGTTAENGSFRLTGVPAGSYALVISRSDVPARRLDVVVSAGQTARVDVQVAVGNVRLDPLVVSASKRPEKAVDAPARVEVVSQAEIQARPATTPVEHLRSVPGVDIAQTGVQSSNVVARGFNNIFSGALHALTDNRIAGVPSLRVNFLHFVPSNNEDIARMEVVLGPGAALYGPNTANGILHIITRSPLDEQSTTASLAGGTRNVLHGEFRTSHLISPRLGIKISGQYLQAEEWEFTDAAELAERGAVTANPAVYRANLINATGISAADADARMARIGTRDFDISRWSVEGRADWQLATGTTAIFSAGTTTAANGIELTGLGAAQVEDWRYSYYQARLNSGRLFAQVYLNQSNAGDTYLLRNGAPIVDESTLLVGQLQHGLSMWSGRQSFTYGADYLLTTPRTGGTINGWYEEDDGTNEFGAYLQSETELSSRLELVLAGRVDLHSALPDPVFSPRAALVFKPSEGQALRIAFNRAFSTPSSLNQFLDLGSALPGTDAQTAALRQLGYSLRIQGTGENGFSFQQPDGSYLVRSPFTVTSPGVLMPGNGAALFPLMVQVLAANGAFGSNTAFRNYMLGLRPTAAQVGVNYRDLVASGRPQSGPLSSLALADIEPIRESPTTTLEAGYKGLLGQNLLIAADVWWSRREDLVTPLTIQTPLVLLDGPTMVAYLVPRFMADLGMSQAQAQATAVSLMGTPGGAPGLATIPAGVISSADVDARGGQILVTYVNVDETIDLWGSDVSARVLMGNEWALTGSASYVSDNVFRTDRAGLVTLNAPQWKGSVALDYDNDDTGLFGQARMRYTDGFPVNSGVYVGTACLGEVGPLVEPCVDAFTLFDLNLGYRLPMIRGATFSVTVNNLLDEGYRPFPGTPTMGRTIITRLRYDFQ